MWRLERHYNILCHEQAALSLRQQGTLSFVLVVVGESPQPPAPFVSKLKEAASDCAGRCLLQFSSHFEHRLLICLLAGLVFELLGAALGLHLLVVDQVAGGALELTLQLLAGAAGALGRLGALLTRLALELL